MAQKIGYQDGIAGLVGFLSKFPLVKYRPVGDRPASLEQWSWLEKIERTLRILKDDHDAAITSPTPVPPPPPPDPAPAFKRVAPITVTQEGGSDQRVCLFDASGNLRPGVFRRGDGTYGDDSGAVYRADGDGLEDSSVRTKLPTGAYGLATARALDGRSACECAASGDPTKNTGSWTV